MSSQSIGIEIEMHTACDGYKYARIHAELKCTKRCIEQAMEEGENGPKYRYTPRTKKYIKQQEKKKNARQWWYNNTNTVSYTTRLQHSCYFHDIYFVFEGSQWQWQLNICTTCVHICTRTLPPSVYYSCVSSVESYCFSNARTHTAHSYVACFE